MPATNFSDDAKSGRQPFTLGNSNMTTEPKPIPTKWIKRGPQPEVAPKPVSPLVSINNLAKRIREEFDPAEKERLEAQFKAECDAFDAINPGMREVNIAEVYKEASSAMGSTLTIPENVGKGEWTEFHSRLIKCKRSMASWVRDSRRYASGRWGSEFVAAAEQQMELALGIEPPAEQAEKPQHKDDIAFAASIAKRITRWDMSDIDEWNAAKIDLVLVELKPVEDIIQKLKSQVVDV